MTVAGLLFFLFIFLPCAEIFALSYLGAAIGVLPSILIIVLTGMLGATLAREGGLESWRRINACLREGKDPSREMINGLLIFVAGIALIIPGFVTDVIGLLLLTPFVRAPLVDRLARRWHVSASTPEDSFSSAPQDEEVIDIEAKETRSEYKEIDS